MAVRWRRTAIGTGLCALVILAGPGLAVAAGPRTRWVDDDGRAGPRGCDASRRTFRKVQPAIDASGPGDTVVVCPGSYRGDLAVTGPGKDGLTIRGAVRGKARIRASATGGGISLLSISDADGVRVRGLVFQAPTIAPCRKAGALVWVSGSTDVRITRDRLEALGPDTLGPCGYTTGLDVVGDARVVADALTIRDFQKYGVLLQDRASRVVVEDSSVLFLHAREAPDPSSAAAIGLYAIRGGGVTLRRNIIRSAATAGASTPLMGTGIHVYDTSDPLVARNDVSRVTWGISAGVSIGTIRGNTVHDGRPTGPDVPEAFLIDGGEFGSIFDNRAKGFANGIVVDGGAANHAIHDNDFRGQQPGRLHRPHHRRRWHVRDVQHLGAGPGAHGRPGRDLLARLIRARGADPAACPRR